MSAGIFLGYSIDLFEGKLTREREEELSVCRYHVSERIADVFAISFKLIGSTALNVVKINERSL